MVTSMPCANDIVGVDGDVRVELRVLNASKAKLGTEKSSRGNTSQPLKGLRSRAPLCAGNNAGRVRYGRKLQGQHSRKLPRSQRVSVLSRVHGCLA
jgi:hypothetical protein